MEENQTEQVSLRVTNQQVNQCDNVVDLDPSISVNYALTQPHKLLSKPGLPLPKLLTFDGTSWKGFVQQFEMLAAQYDWNKSGKRMEKVQSFYLSLTVKAMEFGANLPDKYRNDYSELK